MLADPKMLTWEDAVIWLRAQPDRQQLVLDAFYDDPLINAAKRYFESREWQAVAEILHRRSGKALDVGAGRGIASYALARSGFAVTALEPDPSSIVGASAIRGLAAEAQLPIEVVSSFSEHLPFADNTFDVALSEPRCITPETWKLHVEKYAVRWRQEEYLLLPASM
jgi:2-polyprenyl-3-methyl-5-hydroxy-6-metoxy-1,4-benzoquinol methylase